MNLLRVSKSITFDMAHALTAHKGKCRNIHGHCYKLCITVLGKVIESSGADNEGMVVDFANLKDLLKAEVTDVFDHSLVLHESQKQLINEQFQAENPTNIIFTAYQPTAENLLIDILSRLKSNLPSELKLVSLKLSESESSFAEWCIEDQETT